MCNQSLDEATNPDEPLSGLQILLVEDEVDMAVLLQFVLEMAGAEVAWVSTSVDALGYLVSFCPHVLISNVRLPDHDGDWLIQEVRRIEQDDVHHIPAIAVTSCIREVSARKMLDAGFERFLDKQTDTDELISTIIDVI